MAVRRRPSYGFNIAGSNLGLRPEAGVSQSVLSQLFPEIKFGAPVATDTTTEEVEKPAEGTTAAAPTGVGVTALSPDEAVPGSELDTYKVSGSMSYAAPFNIQVGPSGPQGRGSRLGYSGATGTTTPTTPTTTQPSQTASSVPLPEYKMPEIDLSPYESALSESQNIISNLSQQLSDIMGSYQQGAQQTIEPEAPKPTETTQTPTAPTTAAPAPLRLQIKEAAQAGEKPTVIGKTGIQNILAGGADPNQIEKQARAAGVTLGEKAQSAVDRAQVQQIAAAPVGLQQQVQQIAKATDSGKITQSAVKALIESGTSAARIEKVAERQGIDIGKQAQQLINQAQAKKKK